MIHQLKDIAFLTIDGYSRREYPQVSNYGWWRRIISAAGEKSEFWQTGEMGWQRATILGSWLRKVIEQLGEGTRVIYGLGDHHQPFASHIIILSYEGIPETRRLRGTTFHLEQFEEANHGRN